MVGLMNRSIDLFEELAAVTDFGFNRNGYLFVTADPERLESFRGQVDQVAALGAEAEVVERARLHSAYPFLTECAIGGLRVPRAGWFRAQDLGQWMLDRARQAGVGLMTAEVADLAPGSITTKDGSVIGADEIVVSAGPHSRDVAALAGIELPLFSELHLKVAFKDHLSVIPRDAPMTIWSDTQVIDWSDEEREGLAEMGRDDLLGEMPVFCHFRPEGGGESPYVLALWEYHNEVMEPTWPLPDDPLYPEVVMRGLTTMVPGLDVYQDRLPESFVDGGYYTKTVENRPLIGPTPVPGISIVAGLSGFGVMISSGAADLLARHLTGAELPSYSSAFLLSRYEDPGYVHALDGEATGQL
jgi:glycine/D-amino acid oxidase-like deaminating enzyme